MHDCVTCTLASYIYPPDMYVQKHTNSASASANGESNIPGHAAVIQLYATARRAVTNDSLVRRSPEWSVHWHIPEVEAFPAPDAERKSQICVFLRLGEDYFISDAKSRIDERSCNCLQFSVLLIEFYILSERNYQGKDFCRWHQRLRCLFMMIKQ